MRIFTNVFPYTYSSKRKSAKLTSAADDHGEQEVQDEVDDGLSKLNPEMAKSPNILVKKCFDKTTH